MSASETIRKQVLNLEEWKLVDEKTIQRIIRCEDYVQTVQVVNLIAQVAEELDHHPEVTFSYYHCKVSFTTHETDSLTQRDVDAAKEINIRLM